MASSEFVVGTARRQLSQILKGYSNFEDENAVNYVFATVDVKQGNGGAGTITPIGTALVWESGVSAFIPYEGGTEVADAITDDNSTIGGGGAVVCVTVGQAEGKGLNKEDLTLSTVAQKVTVIYRGVSVVKDGPVSPNNKGGEGIQWDDAVDDTEADLFKDQLERQGVGVFPISTETVTPFFVEA